MTRLFEKEILPWRPNARSVGPRSLLICQVAQHFYSRASRESRYLAFVVKSGSGRMRNSVTEPRAVATGCYRASCFWHCFDHRHRHSAKNLKTMKSTCRPDGPSGILIFVNYKDAGPTGLTLHGTAANNRSLPLAVL